jgi:hypothetical protein
VRHRRPFSRQTSRTGQIHPLRGFRQRVHIISHQAQ